MSTAKIPEVPPDTRYVYGACCTWHGSIHEVAVNTGSVHIDGKTHTVSLPVCPHCGGPLMEYPDRQTWDRKAVVFAETHPNMPLYLDWLESLHAPCTPLDGWDWVKAYRRFEQAQKQAQKPVQTHG